jgi:hypothetical protein
MPRIELLAPPYSDAVPQPFDRVMPKGVPPRALFRTLAVNERDTVRGTKRMLVVVALLATTGVAHADDLVLHPGDSLTIDGKRYNCDDSTRRGVSMSPGDSVTAGGRRLRCDGNGVSAPATPAIAVTSTVDATCLHTVHTFAGSMDAFALAKACRPLAIAPTCKVTATTRDDNCIRALEFSFHPDPEALVTACNRIEASCPAPGARTVASQEPQTCVAHLVSSRGSPNSTDLISWLRSCNPAPTGKCIAVSAAHIDRCWMSILTWYSQPPAALAAEMVARCAQVQYRCE